MKALDVRCVPLLVAALCVGLPATFTSAAVVNVTVTIENLTPSGGTGLTPVWVGFHDGSFDSYNSGAAAGRAVAGVERLAEDGNTSVLSGDFQAGFTYVDASGVNSRVAASGSTAKRVDGTIGSLTGPPPLLPGQSASMDFAIHNDGSNDFFSYASMVLPSNDFFVANGNPAGIDLSSILQQSGGTISFLIGAPSTVNDAGTEAEDFNSSAANGLFGLTGGQTGPDQGADDPTAFVRNIVGDPYAGFANIPAGADLSRFNFNNSALYANGGIGRITITAETVPEPSTFAIFGIAMACFGCARLRRRRRQ